ncbi:LysR substrate-binding domain-containing protein [Mycobacterium sp. 21AC1]|uniref:LysR substrate-binding domain-containing protein n=1 Tax=[Mycobacterium] appelbergii TaxID=2939269 RepID=UPI002938EB8B|nr:LysR substrate-binding domain-containing protein [Mycobacterium sp. 21AC1]MDV3127246.1 LysR substrate-binding domain-containing protein [Mycobacterium sp. 21AC1]
MKLQQLEIVLEIVKNGFHISAAARALHTSQPGVSRQLQMLESELGFPVFARTRNHIDGLTEAGEIVADIARRVTGDLETLKNLEDHILAADKGTLTIATTHTHASYVLPKVIASFIRAYPDVQVIMRQGDPDEVSKLVQDGEADLAVSSESQKDFPDLVKLPCFALPRVLVTPNDHPLTKVKQLQIEDIARYPILTYDHHFSGYWKVMKAFQSVNLTPRIVLSAIDAGVCKTYVEMGLGIAILAEITVVPERDVGLTAIPVSHLFESSTTYVKLRPSAYPRRYLLSFIERIAPRLTPDVVRSHLRT